ncbi:MAG TPA: hypothetical protein VF472_12590 [Burkholderiaceae bacterium]
MPTTFTKDAVDGRLFQRFITDHYRGILVVLILPLVLHQFGPLVGRQYDLMRTYTVLLCFMIFSIPLRIWTTMSRTNWGESLTFADDLRIQKKDGATVVIDRSAIQNVRISPDKMIAIVWKNNGKNRFCIIGKEGFTSTTWRQLESFARTWLPKR